MVAKKHCTRICRASFAWPLMAMFAMLFAAGSLPARPQHNPDTPPIAAQASAVQDDDHSHAESSHAGMVDMNSASMFLMNEATGTAVNPASWLMPMRMMHFGSWNISLMGYAFIVDTQQSGPRGGDKLYSPNVLMATAEHRVGSSGAFEAELMLSLEPATFTDRRYPLLFQTGETAYGVPIVDGQHPHNFIMGLGFHYTRELAEDTILEAYFAPVGDPALGPVAYPHRASAAELPQATLSHHLQDSTHISDEVFTLGISHKKIKLEASGFYGSEPGENRWTIEAGPINSWSTRLWFFPAKNWAVQASVGRIAHPEALEPGDQIRSTASVEYSKPLAGGSWSSSLIWGRTHNIASQHNLNSYLVESVLPVHHVNFITGRFELVDKDELFSDQPNLGRQLDALYGSTFRIGAYTAGYTRDINLFRDVETGIGANFTTYSLPGAIKPYYGDRPVGGNIFIRIRLKSSEVKQFGLSKRKENKDENRIPVGGARDGDGWGGHNRKRGGHIYRRDHRHHVRRKASQRDVEREDGCRMRKNVRQRPARICTASRNRSREAQRPESRREVSRAEGQSHRNLRREIQDHQSHID